MENKRKGLNRKAFPKFMLWVLGGAVFGFCAGLAGSILEDLNVAETVETRLAAVLTAIAPWGIPVTSAVLLAVCLRCYTSAKRLFQAWDGEDETLPEQVDQKLNYVLLCATLAMVLDFFFIAVGVFYTDSAALALLIVGEMAVSVALVTVAQQKTVDLTRKMNPEKQVSVYDTKFQEKWYENCDEAERAQIGQASFRAFRAVNLFCPILWVVLLLLNYVFPIGLLPMATVLLVWAVLEISYIGECIRLGKRKGAA